MSERDAMASAKPRRGYGWARVANLVLAVAVLAAFSTWASQAQASDAAVQEQITAAERATQRGPYGADGVFTGSAQGFGGLVEMQATIQDGYITAVEILDASHEDEAWLNMAVVLVDRIVQEQTTNLDVVSGATYSSAGILNGTAEALRASMEGGAR